MTVTRPIATLVEIESPVCKTPVPHVPLSERRLGRVFDRGGWKGNVTPEARREALVVALSPPAFPVDPEEGRRGSVGSADGELDDVFGRRE